MWRIFNPAALALVLVGRVGAQDKRLLIMEMLQTVGDYRDIVPVWGIAQKDGDIYRFIPPVALLKERYRTSDRYGYRMYPISGERQFHVGLDMAAVHAAIVYAAANGTVMFAGETPGYGKTVTVTHRLEPQTRHAHLIPTCTRKGAKVEKGDTTGSMGSIGASTRNHLYYEAIKDQKRINPLDLIYRTK